MAELLYKDEIYAIVGAAMEVFNQLGPGFSEAIYQESLEIELNLRKLPNKPQQEIFISYRGTKLRQFFKPDFICYDNIIVEIKAIDKLTSREEAQLLNYLKATGMQAGVLVNFGADKDLEWKRMVATGQKNVPTSKILTPPKFPRINNPKPFRED